MGLFAGTQWDRPVECERCGLVLDDCRCPPPSPAAAAPTPPSKQRLRVRVEKRKRGKVVTVIQDVAPDNDRTALLAELKAACGAGGSINEDGWLEIQGAHVERVAAALRQRGYRVP